jgi:(2Fe-2S) ferredoxin
MKFEKHIFICTNERFNGNASCGESKGLALVDAFKALVNAHKLNVSVRAQKAGCLDVCAHGPALVVYPEGIFYGKIELSDVQEIFSEHIQQGKPVERLRLKF